MARWVKWGGKLYPRSFAMPVPTEPWQCMECGGLKLVPETIDNERADVMVRCQHCQMFCTNCRQWADRYLHKCRG